MIAVVSVGNMARPENDGIAGARYCAITAAQNLWPAGVHEEQCNCKDMVLAFRKSTSRGRKTEAVVEDSITMDLSCLDVD